MVGVWFMALAALPACLVLKVDALNDTITFRWENMASIGVGAFVLSIFWRWSMNARPAGRFPPALRCSLRPRAEAVGSPSPAIPSCLGLIAVDARHAVHQLHAPDQHHDLADPSCSASAPEHRGRPRRAARARLYAAFYAVGAYTYGLLNTYFGLGFWAVLPVGGIMAALFGLMLGSPSCGSRATIWPS